MTPFQGLVTPLMATLDPKPYRTRKGTRPITYNPNLQEQVARALKCRKIIATGRGREKLESRRRT